MPFLIMNLNAPSARVRLAFTGRSYSGKDYVAQACGATVISIAEPFYALARNVVPNCSKQVEGAREFYQQVGNWGRGFVSAACPITASRLHFVSWIRKAGARLCSDGGLAFSGVDWPRFGLDQNLWIEAALARADQDPSPVQAFTNVRFETELFRVVERGYKVFHVWAQDGDRVLRATKLGHVLSASASADETERLATDFDRRVELREPPGRGAAGKEISCPAWAAVSGVVVNSNWAQLRVAANHFPVALLVNAVRTKLTEINKTTV